MESGINNNIFILSEIPPYLPKVLHYGTPHFGKWW